METILAEMRVLFDSRNRFFWGSPIALEKFPDLTDFPDLPPADLLQNLQMPTTLDSAESGGRPAPSPRVGCQDIGGRTTPTGITNPRPATRVCPYSGANFHIYSRVNFRASSGTDANSGSSRSGSDGYHRDPTPSYKSRSRCSVPAH